MQRKGIFNSPPAPCSHGHARPNIAVRISDSFEHATRLQNAEYIFSELETLMSCMFCWCYVNSFDCVKLLITRFTILGEKSGKNIQFIFFCVNWSYQLSNTCPCGLFDDNFCKMLTKSNMAIQMNLFKFEKRKSGFIRQAKQQRSSRFFVNNSLQSVCYGIW